MNIRQAQNTDKNSWNNFISNQKMGSFLQSWEWSEFVESQGKKVWRFIIENDKTEIISVLFFYKSNLKLGQSMLYAPKGPVIEDNQSLKEVFQLLQTEVDKIAKQEKVLSFELDPETDDSEFSQLLNDNNYNKTNLDAQPRHTLILSLNQSEEDLLSQMHSKTRYNIRLADKKGIEIIIDNSDFKSFWELQKKTEERQNISMYNQEYYKKLLQLPFVKLYLAKYQGKTIAANIMIFWNNTAIYLFGSSDYEHRKIMAPHLLQWQAIKDAKKQNIYFYDFWGAAPKTAKGREQNWSGFTRFKMGFSPNAEITEYIGTYEKIYKPTQLGVYRFLQTLKR